MISSNLIEWIFLITLRSKVMATFALGLGLLRFLMNFQYAIETAMTSFHLE